MRRSCGKAMARRRRKRRKRRARRRFVCWLRLRRTVLVRLMVAAAAQQAAAPAVLWKQLVMQAASELVQILYWNRWARADAWREEHRRRRWRVVVETAERREGSEGWSREMRRKRQGSKKLRRQQSETEHWFA